MIGESRRFSLSSLLIVISSFVVILLCSRKLALGYALLIGALFIALFQKMGWADFGGSILQTVSDKRCYELLAVMLLILVLSDALRSSGQLERITTASGECLRDTRLVVSFLPALIGMLPMIGGAYFSAPMVETSLRHLNIKPEKKVFINYWFRHIWEYVLPLYPGIIALASLCDIELSRLIRVNSILSLSAITIGVIIAFGSGGFRPAGKARACNISFRRAVKRFFYEGLPIIFAIAPVIIFGIPVVLSLFLGIICVYIMNRSGAGFIWKTIKKGASVEMLLLVAAIMLYKDILINCGAVSEMASFLESQNIGALPIIFSVCFLSGLITGVSIGFVGISLPIVLAVIPEVNPWNMMFVFSCGFAGVLLSPVHVCLIMTSKYFKVDMWRVYRYIVPAVLVILGVGFLGYVWG